MTKYKNFDIVFEEYKRVITSMLRYQGQWNLVITPFKDYHDKQLIKNASNIQIRDHEIEEGLQGEDSY